MKHVIYFLAFSLLLVACSKRLVETPRNFISTSNFFNTAEDAEAAVLGAYNIVASQPFMDQFIELHSDFTVGRGSWAPLNVFDKVLAQAEIDRAYGFFWGPWYSMINRTNTVLENLPDMEQLPDAQKKTLLAEAHFLRGMAYFDLVRGFGPVPIRASSMQNVAEIGAPRAPEAEVYDLIEEDLKHAEANLPLSVGANTGRASVWAAKMMLAQVYLTRERWDEAAAQAEDVILNGPYSLVEVQQPNDFYNIFAVSTSSEDIMSKHYAALLQDSYVLTLHRPNIPEWNNSSTGFYTTLPVMTSFLGTWDDNDLRKSFNLYSEYKNASGNTVPLPSVSPILFKKFISLPDGIRANSRPLLRLAEAYLIYAEAKTMADGSPSSLALERLNVIRRRAYGHDPYQASPDDFPSGMTKDEFRDVVIQERAYEFMHEQRRWWDLKRIGKAKEIIEAATGKTFDANSRLLFPIPIYEIDSNPEINQEDQNAGY